ncbi:hypothetical protein Dimus_014944 [Dionaea muscipula]
MMWKRKSVPSGPPKMPSAGMRKQDGCIVPERHGEQLLAGAGVESKPRRLEEGWQNVVYRNKGKFDPSSRLNELSHQAEHSPFGKGAFDPLSSVVGCDDGTRAEAKLDIETEVLQFYQELLGTEVGSAAHFDEECLEEGNCLNQFQMQALTTAFSTGDVRTALWGDG